MKDGRGKLIVKVKSLRCKGLCWESCGPIFVGPHELSKIRFYCDTTGKEYHDLPFPDGGIDGLVLKVMQDLEKKTDELSCPYLKDKRCSIYPVRPMICKLWGATEGMECPFGCKPGKGYLTRDKAWSLLGHQ